MYWLIIYLKMKSKFKETIRIIYRKTFDLVFNRKYLPKVIEYDRYQPNFMRYKNIYFKNFQNKVKKENF